METNINHLERWLGADVVRDLGNSMGPWYGPRIPVHVPGHVYAEAGGFSGKLLVGQFASRMCWLEDRAKRLHRHLKISNVARDKLNVGFATFSALKQAWQNGQSYPLMFNSGVTTVTSSGISYSLWENLAANIPPNGTDPSSSGRNPIGGTDGGFYLPDCGSGNWYVTGAEITATTFSTNQNPGCLLLYDRLFDINFQPTGGTATAANSTTLTRYTATPLNSPTSAAGNFMFPEIATANVTNISSGTFGPNVYSNEAGTGSRSTLLPLYPSAITAKGTIPLIGGSTAGTWFIGLQAGDLGISAVASVGFTNTSGTGLTPANTFNFVVGHPIGFFPAPFAGVCADMGGVTSAAMMSRVLNGACLSLLQISTSPAWLCAGIINLVGG